MLAMNKLYVGDDDQLGFLLIDDPVQTMDDINMASLVELLRNEFDDKQMILSTLSLIHISEPTRPAA